MKVNAVITKEGLNIKLQNTLNTDGYTGYLSSYILKPLSDAIGTTYIPMGDTISWMVSHFMNTQMGRTFNPGCGTPAGLEMEFNERRCSFLYESTSGTQVNIYLDFDQKSMTPIAYEVHIYLDGDRAMPGRCHYEGITRLIPEWDWENAFIAEMQENANQTPHWMLNQLSSTNLYDEQLDAAMLDLGFERTAPVLNYERVWKRGENDWIALMPDEDLPVDQHKFAKFKAILDGKSINYDRAHSFYLKELQERLSRPKADKRHSQQSEDIQLEDIEYTEEQLEDLDNTAYSDEDYTDF